MKNLLISGNTGDMIEWNLDTIFEQPVKSKNRQIDDMIQNDWDNRISRCGMTYLEIEQFNNQYNNF